MRPLLDSLFLYAQEKQVPRYLQTPEYRQTVAGIEESWDAFRSALTEEQEKQLDELLALELKTSYLEDEAVFLSGLSIGLDLGRL